MRDSKSHAEVFTGQDDISPDISRLAVSKYIHELMAKDLSNEGRIFKAKQYSASFRKEDMGQKPEETMSAMNTR